MGIEEIIKEIKMLSKSNDPVEVREIMGDALVDMIKEFFDKEAQNKNIEADVQNSVHNTEVKTSIDSTYVSSNTQKISNEEIKIWMNACEKIEMILETSNLQLSLNKWKSSIEFLIRKELSKMPLSASVDSGETRNLIRATMFLINPKQKNIIHLDEKEDVQGCIVDWKSSFKKWKVWASNK